MIYATLHSSVWGSDPFFKDDPYANGYNIHIDPTTISHTNILDVGTHTHPDIDIHLAETVNPHSSPMTQTTMAVDTITSSGPVPVGGVAIANDELTSDPPGTPISMPSGVALGSSGFLFTQYYSVIISAQPTQHIWAAPPTITFAFNVINGSLWVNIMNPYVDARVVSQSIIFTGIVPALLRPPANRSKLIAFQINDTSTGVGPANLTLSSNGNLTIGPLASIGAVGGILCCNAFMYNL